MFEEIHWDKFDWRHFQRLCNSLLINEISSELEAYSETGQDGGIDQYFNGNYNNRNGLWRFQDKFKDSRRIKKEVFNELRSDVRREILKITDENFVFILTNVNLSVKEVKNLKDLAEVEISKIGKQTIFEIWHHETISSLLTNYPLVYFRFIEPEKLLLESYKDFFFKELNANESELINQFNKAFVGREDILAIFYNFLNSPEKVLEITGEGGIGKTRLCLEFFKSIASEWKSFILLSKDLPIELVERQLFGNSKTLIFIDDAHEDNKPKLLRDLKRIIENKFEHIKIIYTTRPTSLQQIYDHNPSHSNRRPQSLSLSKLSYEQTILLIENLVPRINEKAKYLVADYSNGVPFIILACIEAINQGENLVQIPENELVKITLQKIIKQKIKRVEEQTDFDLFIINEIYDIICLTNPISDISGFYIVVSNFLKIEEYKVERIVNELINQNALKKSDYFISVKPDAFKEIALIEKLKLNSRWINQFFENEIWSPKIPAIISNLAVISWKIQNNYLENWLEGYLNQIKSTEITRENLLRILGTMRQVSAYFPVWGIKTIEKYSEMLENDSLPIFEEHDFFINEIEQKYPYIDEIKKIINISVQANKSEQFYENCWNLLYKLYKKTNDNSLVLNTFSYNYDEFYYYTDYFDEPFIKQKFLTQKTQELLFSSDYYEHQLAIESIKNLLMTSANYADWFNKYTHSVHFGHYHFTNLPEIEAIRYEVFNTIIKFIQSDNTNHDTKKTLFDLLNRVLFDVQGNQKGKYDTSKDLVLIIEFLIDFLPNAGIEFKTKIFQRLQQLQSEQIHAEWKGASIRLLEICAVTNSLYEKLYQLYSISDYRKDEIFKKSLIKIYSKYEEFDSFLIDFMKLLENIEPYKQHQIGLGIHTIAEYSKEAGLRFMEYFLEQKVHLSLIKPILISFVNDKIVYEKNLNKLFEINQTDSNNIAIDILCHKLAFAKQPLSAYEWDKIKEGILENPQMGNRIVYFEIQRFLEVDKENSHSFLLWLFEQKIPKIKESFTHSFVHFTDELKKEYKFFLKEMLFDTNEVWRFDEYWWSEIFQYIVDEFSESILLELILKQAKIAQNLEFYWTAFELPNTFYHSSNDIKPNIRFFNIFKKILVEYVELNKYIIEEILEYYLPRFDIEFIKDLQNFLFFTSNEVNYQNRFLQSLGIFKKHDIAAKLDIVKTIFESHLQSKNKKIAHDEFNSILFHGSRSKSGNGAFPRDIELKRCIEEYFSQELHENTRKLFEQYYQRVCKIIIEDEKDNDWDR